MRDDPTGARSWHRAAIRHPRRALVLAGLLLAAALPGWTRLELRVDGGALTPEAAPEVREDRAIRQRFGARDPVAVVALGAAPGDLFEPRVLRWVEDVTAALVALEDVGPAQVTSLATEKNFRFRDDSLKFRGLLEPVPSSREELDRLRDDLERIGLYRGTLVADDARGTAILVGTPPDADRVAFYERVLRAVAAHPLDGFRVDVIGAPVAEALLGHHVLDDLGVPRGVLGAMPGAERARHPGMVPVALLATALVLLVAFRRPLPVLATLGLVGASLGMVLGAMGWLGVPVYLTLAVMPVLLTALGVADAIHLLLRVQEHRCDRPDATMPEIVAASVDELAAPVERTSWTTAVAFLSFAVSPLEAVRVFGLATAFGVLVLMVGALTVLPAALCLVPPTWIAPAESRRGPTRLARALARIGLAVRRRRVAVWIGVGLAVLVAADGVRRVRVHDSWLDGFAPQSAFARATERFETHFYGAHRLLVEVRFDTWRLDAEVDAEDVDHHAIELRVPSPWPDDLPRDAARLVGSRVRVAERAKGTPRDWQSWVETARYETRDGDTVLRVTTPRFEGSPRFWLRPAPGDRLDVELWAVPLQSPDLVRRVAELEAFLANEPGVGGVLGPARYLETTAFMMEPDDPSARRLPETPDEASILWHNYGVVRGDARLGRLVTPAFDRGLVAVYQRGSNYTDTGRLMRTIRDFEAETLRSVGGRVAFAGDVAVSQALIAAVVRTQTRSLVLSLTGIFLVAALLFRSGRRGLACVAPSALVVWLDFALMGWLGIPLGVATSMFAGMTLGVGVDYAIHLLARHDHAACRGVVDPAADALVATGPAIVVNALAVGLGFGVLLLSQVPGNARLGFLLVASVFGCLVATFFLVPSEWAGARGEGQKALD